MALNWIKWVKGLSRRREVLAVAKTLDLDRRIVATACMEMWEWADENTTTGLVNTLSTNDIDLLVGITGFGSALATVGWLDVRKAGIQFPRWDRHNSQSAKERALDSERKRQKRMDESVQNPSGEKPDRLRTRSDQRRGEENGDVLTNLTLEELRQPGSLLARWERVRGREHWPDNDMALVRFLALAILSSRKPKPCGFFRRAVETGDTRGVLPADEDLASKALKLIRGKPSQVQAVSVLAGNLGVEREEP